LYFLYTGLIDAADTVDARCNCMIDLLIYISFKITNAHIQRTYVKIYHGLVDLPMYQLDLLMDIFDLEIRCGKFFMTISLFNRIINSAQAEFLEMKA
jgi:hypothetical protein